MTLGQNIIKNIVSKLEKTDTQIADLKAEISKIESKLSEKQDDFSIKAVNEQRELQSQKNMYKKALERAEQHRVSLIEDHTDETIKDSVEAIDTRIVQAQKDVDEKNALIQAKVNEIREIHQEMMAIDGQATDEIRHFIKEVKPLLSQELRKDLMLYGQLQPASELLDRKVRTQKDSHNYLTVTKGYSEYQDGIKGLVPK